MPEQVDLYLRQQLKKINNWNEIRVVQNYDILKKVSNYMNNYFVSQPGTAN